MDDQEIEEMTGKIPMHYAYFRKNDDCGIPDSEIEKRIPNSLKEATTFEEMYNALCDFKVNLESTQVIDKVTVTMDVPDVPTGNDEEVMVDLVINAKNGFYSNIIAETPKGRKDVTIGLQESYYNVSNHLDYIVSQYKYDVVRGNRVFQTAYSHPRGFFDLPLSIEYQNNYQNLLPESSVKVESDVLSFEIASRDLHAFMNLQCAWRNVIPFGDLDEERILKVHCSNSMLKECRPSLRTGITIGYRDDTRDSQQQPTEGSYSLIAMTLNGLLGDVHSIQLKHSFEKHIPIIAELSDEPGLLFHIKTNFGFNHNFGNRTTRYVDRFFMNESQIRGYNCRDFGPKSSADDGGKKEGDVLGGDYFATLSVALSLPVVISDEYTMDIRSKLFFDMGNIWNKDQNLKSVWNTKKTSWGISISMPFMSSSIFEVYYLFNKKQFGFSYTMN